MRIRSIFAAATAAALALLLSACVPGTAGAGDAPSSAPAKKLTAEDVKALGGVTLTMQDFGDLPALDNALKKVISSFEADYPNVSIERSTRPFDAYSDTLRLNLASNDAPDVFQLATTRELIKGKLIRPLDDYYKAYGWDEGIPANVDRLLRISEDSSTVGEGPRWGGMLGGNIVVVYYNKSVLKSLGLSVPKTYSEFEDSLAKAKDAGVTGIQLGNAEAFPGGHVIYAIQSALGDQHESLDWFTGKKGATYVTDSNLEAATDLQSWVKNGYLPEGVNGVAVATAREAFVAGEGLYNIGTSYLMGGFSSKLGADLGAFVLPGKNGNDSPSATGTAGDQFGISTASKHADLAAYFLNYMADSRFAGDFAAAGYLPYDASRYTPPADAPGIKDVVDEFQQVTKADGFVPFPDNATPSMGTVTGPQTQSLIGLSTDPEAYLDAIQSNWSAFYSK